jgi:hypothetical protein
MAAVLFSMWLAVALAARADAASLHKCKHAGGGISYQSAPCGPGEQQVWARELMPDGESVPKPSRVAAARVPAAGSQRAARQSAAEVSLARLQECEGSRRGLPRAAAVAGDA